MKYSGSLSIGIFIKLQFCWMVPIFLNLPQISNFLHIFSYFIYLSITCRPTSRSSGGTNQNNNGGVALPVGLADDQAKDFDFEKTEMKYDSTGMFHWGPAKNLEECILVSFPKNIESEWVTRWIKLTLTRSGKSYHFSILYVTSLYDSNNFKFSV